MIAVCGNVTGPPVLAVSHPAPVWATLTSSVQRVAMPYPAAAPNRPIACRRLSRLEPTSVTVIGRSLVNHCWLPGQPSLRRLSLGLAYASKDPSFKFHVRGHFVHGRISIFEARHIG